MQLKWQHVGAAGVLGLVLLAATGGRAAVFNIQLYSDSNPDYTTRESFLETALPVWAEPQDQAIAIWRWGVRNRRQTHVSFEEGRPLLDPILFFNSYANTYCGYIAGMQQSLVDAMGGDWRARYVELSDHTVMEMSWDAGATWHMFDASMNIYCHAPDGTVASVTQIGQAHASDLSAWLGEAGPVVSHDYLYGFATECGSNPVNPQHAGDLGYTWGYRIAADNPVPNTRTLRNGADSYQHGVQLEDDYTHIRAGHRYRLNLRRHESYTRYWSHLGETIDFCRPTTDTVDPDDIEVAGDMRGNGSWSFTPDLSTTDYRLDIYDETATLHRSENGGQGAWVHPQAAGAPAALIYKVYGANVVTSGSLHLQARRLDGGDALSVSVSRDAGITWQGVWSASTTGPIDTIIPLPAALVGGCWEYLCRIEMVASGARTDCGVDGVALQTITQVNRLALPRLQRGANQVRLRLGEQQESTVLWPPLHDGGTGPLYLRTAVSSANVFATGDALQFLSAVLRPQVSATPAQVTWRLTTPTPITGLTYGGSVFVRERTAQDYVTLSRSFDGTNFVVDSTYRGIGAPTWDTRLYASPTDLPADQRSVWLRYGFSCGHDQDYASTGIQDALMTVAYAPRDPQAQPIEVTYCWTEHRTTGDVERRHTQIVDDVEDIWTIDVAGVRDPTMNWIRVNLAGYGPDGAATPGYDDGVDVGPDAGYDAKKYVFRWQDNLAFGRPYTVSRGSWTLNPDADGHELTNGCIVPPTSYSTAIFVQDQTAFWQAGAPVVVTVDLGQVRTVAGYRITTHQPNGVLCHPARIVVEVAGNDGAFHQAGVITHAQVWSPPGDYLGHEFAGSPEYAALPAGGRLAFAFWLVPATASDARYVRCTFEPQPGRGIGISEIQALSHVDVVDWPDREIYVPTTTVAVRDHDPAAPTSAPGHAALLSAAPDPFNGVVTFAFVTPVSGRVSLDIYDIAGRRVRRLLDDVWRPAGGNTAVWPADDDQRRPLPSGTYLCRLRAGLLEDVRRVTLVK